MERYSADVEQFRALLRARTEGRGELTRLAERSGIARIVLVRWRDGEYRPRPEGLEKLAPVLDVPYETLLRMCGYLDPGAPADQLEPRISQRLLDRAKRWQELIDAGYPESTVLAVMDANLRMAELTANTPAVREPTQPTVREPIRPLTEGPVPLDGPLEASKQLVGLSGGRR